MTQVTRFFKIDIFLIERVRKIISYLTKLQFLSQSDEIKPQSQQYIINYVSLINRMKEYPS